MFLLMFVVPINYHHAGLHSQISSILLQEYMMTSCDHDGTI